MAAKLRRGRTAAEKAALNLRLCHNEAKKLRLANDELEAENKELKQRISELEQCSNEEE